MLSSGTLVIEKAEKPSQKLVGESQSSGEQRANARGGRKRAIEKTDDFNRCIGILQLRSESSPSQTATLWSLPISTHLQIVLEKLVHELEVGLPSIHPGRISH